MLIVSNLWSHAIAGGAEGHAVELAEHLRARGHEVGAVTLGVEGPDVIAAVRAWPYRPDEFADQPPLRKALFHALDVYRPSTPRVLTDAIDRFRPSIVHSHAVAGLSSTVLTVPSRRGIPHVHTLHDYWLLCQRRSLTRRDGSRCETRCRGCKTVSVLRNSLVARHPPDVVLAVSHAIAEVHREIGWLRPRVRVVPNPVEAVSRTPLPHPDGPVVFGFIGRITVEKGVRTLLEAFARADVGGARLVLAGSGPLCSELRASEISGVELLGWVDGSARRAFFEGIDCLVVPSEWLDPAPLVVGEARARGIPVIGAAIGGIPELVSERSRSLLFPPGDVDALASRLEALAADPSRFVEPEISGQTTWDDHLALVERAYVDAREATAGRSARSA